MRSKTKLWKCIPHKFFFLCPLKAVTSMLIWSDRSNLARVLGLVARTSFVKIQCHCRSQAFLHWAEEWKHDYVTLNQISSSKKHNIMTHGTMTEKRLRDEMPKVCRCLNASWSSVCHPLARFVSWWVWNGDIFSVSAILWKITKIWVDATSAHSQVKTSQFGLPWASWRQWQGLAQTGLACRPCV